MKTSPAQVVVALCLLLPAGSLSLSSAADASTCCKCGSSITTDCPEGAAACSGGFFNSAQFQTDVCGDVPCSTASCTEGIECSDDPECAPVGACCLPDGSCSEDTADVCSIRGGSYNGDGTECEVGLCSPAGCCKCAGSTSSTCPLGSPACSEGFTNEVVYANKVCLPSPCSLSICSFGAGCADTFPECGPLGACCNSDGTCTQDTASSCGVRGGRYAGDGTVCEADTCTPDVPAASRVGLVLLLVLLSAVAIVAITGRAASAAR